MNKMVLSYEEFGVKVNLLADKLKKYNFDAIFGVFRGGLPVATHLSHILNIPLMRDLTQYQSEFLNGLKRDQNQELLIVDDIVDTAATMKRIRESTSLLGIRKFLFASLFKRPNVQPEPDIYLEETPDWVVFPWENVEEMPSDYHQKIYPKLSEKK